MPIDSKPPVTSVWDDPLNSGRSNVIILFISGLLLVIFGTLFGYSFGIKQLDEIASKIQVHTIVKYLTHTPPAPKPVAGIIVVTVNFGIRTADVENLFASYGLIFDRPQNATEIAVEEAPIYYLVHVPVGEEYKWVEILGKSQLIKYSEFNSSPSNQSEN